MIRTVAHLIDTQMKPTVVPDYQRFPFWLGIALNFEPLDDWFRMTWGWGRINANYSHDARPWSETAQSDMLCRLYPDHLPF